MARKTSSIVRLTDERHSVSEAAKTIDLAFSKDPLIKWLRPGQRPWGDLHPAVMNWQRRRIRRFMCNGIVLSIKSNPNPSDVSLKSHLKSMHGEEGEVEEPTDFGAIVMLEPPPTISRTLRSLWPKLRLWFLDKFDPCEDLGSQYSRIQQMLKKHDDCLRDLKTQVQPRRLWYLEVIAVRPSLHGRGLGKCLLQEVINLANGDPIMLECTDSANVAFYQKYGFEVVASTVLCAKGLDGREEIVSYPVMLRR